MFENLVLLHCHAHFHCRGLTLEGIISQVTKLKISDSFELETLQANPNNTALLYKDDDAIRKKFCLKIWSCCIVMRISTVGV